MSSGQPTVQILLSTYNGKMYLREQLNSFADQGGQVKVLIRDDGSSDGTTDILKEYAGRDNYQVEFGRHVGINASYCWLIRNSDPSCMYFALSDQDDVWLPGKLENARDALGQYPAGQLLLYATRTCITDEALHPLKESPLPNREISFFNAMVQNVLPGHTQVFNAVLRDDLAAHSFTDAHVVDWWIYLVASAKGRIIFSEDCSVLHRQHQGNAVGYRLGFMGNLKRRLRYIKEKKGNAISRQLQNFLDIYMDELSEDFRLEAERFLASLDSPVLRLRYLRRCRAYRQTALDTFLFKCLYLAGKYTLPEGGGYDTYSG